MTNDKQHNWATVDMQVGKTSFAFFISSDKKEDGTLHIPRVTVRELFVKKDGTEHKRYVTLPSDVSDKLNEAWDICAQVRRDYFPSKTSNGGTVRVPDGFVPVSVDV